MQVFGLDLMGQRHYLLRHLLSSSQLGLEAVVNRLLDLRRTRDLTVEEIKNLKREIESKKDPIGNSTVRKGRIKNKCTMSEVKIFPRNAHET